MIVSRQVRLISIFKRHVKDVVIFAFFFKCRIDATLEPTVEQRGAAGKVPGRVPRLYSRDCSFERCLDAI